MKLYVFRLMFFKWLNVCLFFIVWVNFLVVSFMIFILLSWFCLILNCVVCIEGLVILVFIILLKWSVSGSEKLFVL